jgi:ABC-type multidrug transport system fused ATPase/permease subunit
MSEIDQKITRAASNLSTMTHDVILELLPAFLGIIVALFASFSLNSTLAWIIVVGVIIYAIIIIRTVGDGAILQRNNQKAWIKAWRERSDGLYNVSTVKQFAAEDYESKKNTTNFIGGVNGAQLKLYALWNSISLSQKIIILLTQSIVLVMSLAFIQKGSMSIGQVIAFNAYVGMMFGPFLRIGQMWRTIQNSIITISDASKIISTSSEEYHAKNSIKKEIVGNVEFKNITFYHDERKKILKNISLKVEAGKKIALVGETGSGKTSLIELIFKFYLPQQGDILIDDISIKDYDLTSLRSQIGVVPQEPVLFDTTILNNITYPKTNVPFEIVREAAKKAELLDFIEDQPDKWKTVVGDRGVKLSGGQKQRIAIARAIIENPKILILDESTSALDAKTQRSIEASLEELMKDRTTFIVAHRLSAVRNADTICVLHKGKILEQGNHQELMEKEGGKYRQLYELQFQEKEIVDQEEDVLD